MSGQTAVASIVRIVPTAADFTKSAFIGRGFSDGDTYSTAKSMPLTIASTTLNASAHQKPATRNPGTSPETTRMMMALMTNVNSPTVMTLIGSVNARSTGRMKALMAPRTIATTSAGTNPETVTHGRTYAVMITAIAVMTMLMMVSMARE